MAANRRANRIRRRRPRRKADATPEPGAPVKVGAVVRGLVTPLTGLHLHPRAEVQPLKVSCGRNRLLIEDGLRVRGVRVVDCWGCIIAPTLLDFEGELAREPVGMRQSSDSA